MKTTTIATFNSIAPAQALKADFEREHIPVEIVDESALSRLWFIKRARAHIKVKVEAGHYDHALRLLGEWHGKSESLKHAVHCPDCGSSRVEYPQFTNKFFLPNLIGLLSAVGIVQKKFYCRDCQYTWPPNGRVVSKSRPHQAPYYFIEGVPQELHGGKV